MTGGPERVRPRVAIAVHDAGFTWGVCTALRELVLRKSDRFRFVIVSTRLRDDLQGRVEFIRVPAPVRPFRLRWAVFFALAGPRLRRARADLVHAISYGPIVPNRVDLASVFFDHAAYQERRGGARDPLARLTVAIDRWGYRRARMLAALAPGGARELERRYSVPVVVTPYLVDAARFYPDAAQRAAVRAEHGVGPSDVVAVFVNNRAWELKGLEEAIAGFAAARARAAELAWFWVIGSGPRSRFEAFAARHGVADRVRFLGLRHDIERLFRGADIFVLPTLFETFSLGVHEAAATGLPVVSTRVFGVEDLLADGAAGIAIERDAGDVASALERLARDGDLRQRLGAEARRRATAFTPEQWVDANVAAYERLLADRPIEPFR